VVTKQWLTILNELYSKPINKYKKGINKKIQFSATLLEVTIEKTIIQNNEQKEHQFAQLVEDQEHA